MPRPLMAVFVALAIAALGLVLWMVFSPPSFEKVPLAERRPPPSGTLSHDVGGLIPAPIPSPVPAFAPPCEALEGVGIEGGEPAIARFGEALRALCTVAGPGVPAEVSEAVRALNGVTIRFARFGASGVDSTADLSNARIWLNLRFARSGTPALPIAPLLAHEAAHFVTPGPVTAAGEFRARRVELETCRQLIQRDRWPRPCDDAAELVALGEPEALARLRAAGYSD